MAMLLLPRGEDAGNVLCIEPVPAGASSSEDMKSTDQRLERARLCSLDTRFTYMGCPVSSVFTGLEASF